MSAILCADRSILDLAAQIILFFTLIVTCYLAYLARKANYATAYKVARDILQDQEIREARKHVFTILKFKEYEKWSKKDIAEAEKVCQSYDSVGQMVRKKMLPEDYIVDNWFVGLKDSWDILKKLVVEYRKERDYPKNWDDYEYLAKRALALYGQQK